MSVTILARINTTFKFAAFLLAACAITSCSKEEAARMSVDIRTDTRDAIYDFRDFDYAYARAEALPKTNLEPAPTSYALFPTAKLETAITGAGDKEYETITKLRKRLGDKMLIFKSGGITIMHNHFISYLTRMKTYSHAHWHTTWI